MKDIELEKQEALPGGAVSGSLLEQPPAVPPQERVPGYAALPPPSTYSNASDSSCACSGGWVLFGVGFIFPVCWIVGLFLPSCTKDLNDSKAQKACGVALFIFVLLVIIRIAI